MANFISDQLLNNNGKRNFWSLDTLIKFIAPEAVRRRFDGLIPPSELADVLNKNITIIEDLWRNKKVIKKYQLDLLVNVPGVKLPFCSHISKKKGTSSNDFDLTLMICILRNLNFVSAPSNGWDNLPPKEENSLGANLARVKIYRNEVSHPSNNEIDDNSFQNMWTTLKKALSEMSDGSTDSYVSEIEKFDFERKDTYMLSSKLQRDIEDLRKALHFQQNLTENTSSVLEDWKQDLKLFYKTKGTEKVMHEIRDHSVVMITGNPGTGKTTAMRYASLQLQEDGYEIVLISSPNNIPAQRFISRKQLFVMDDVIGPYRVDNMALDLWRRLRDQINVVFKCRTAKLLMTLRRQIHKSTGNILPSSIDLKVVDLSSKSLGLSEDEKKGMLETYLKNGNIFDQIDPNDMTEICSCEIAFPLLCKMFTSKIDFLKQKGTFFGSPSKIFKQELDNLQNDNENLYCVLVLLLIFYINELQCIFDENTEINRSDIYTQILRACGVSENISRKSLHKHLHSMRGSYVESTNPFRFIHCTLEETLATHFFTSSQELFFKCCKLDFIRDRVRLSTEGESLLDYRSIVVLNDQHYENLSERILEEIKNGKFHDVLLSEPMHNEKFINIFVSYAEKNGVTLDRLGKLKSMENISHSHVERSFMDVATANRYGLIQIMQKRETSFIDWVAAIGSFPLFKTVFEGKNIIEKFLAVTNLLRLAVLGGNIDIIKFLIDKGGNVMSYDEYGIPLLCKVAGTNRCDIADLLIDHGADVNQCDQVMGWTACFVACWFNEIEMLKLLMNRGANIGIRDSRGMTPMVLAVMQNYTQVVSVLYEKDPYISGQFHSSILVRIREILTIRYAKTSLRKFWNNKQTSFVYLRPMNQNTALMQKMVYKVLKDVKSKSSVKGTFLNDFVALCNAEFSNDTRLLSKFFEKKEVTSAILQNIPPKYFNLCPLHVAVICGEVQKAKLLTKKGDSPLKRDICGRNSLHLANSTAMLEILFNAKYKHEHSIKKTLQSKLTEGIKFCFSFQFIPVLFQCLTSRSDLYVNFQDNCGNTPLHSILENRSDINQCLDAVETLVKHGADINIRNEYGVLAIDYFRANSLKFDESVVDRGENLLGGEKHWQHVRREKMFFTTLICIFIFFYIWLYIIIAKRLYLQNPGEQVSSIKINWFVSYTQICTFFFMHWIFRYIHSFQGSSAFGRFKVTPNFDKIYSEKLFFNFSEKISIAFVVVRGFCSMSNNSMYTDIFFSIYCTLFCTFYLFIIVSFSATYRKKFYKHHFSCILAGKIVLLIYMFVWVLYLMFFTRVEQSFTDLLYSYVKFNELGDLFIFIVLKLVLFYLYQQLFLFHMLRPLLYTIRDPVLWHRHDIYDKLRICEKLYFIIDVMSVPFTLVWYSFSCT